MLKYKKKKRETGSLTHVLAPDPPLLHQARLQSWYSIIHPVACEPDLGKVRKMNSVTVTPGQQARK